MELFAQAPPQHQYVLGLTEVFTLFFVMLGPIKLVVPFAHMTKAVDAAAMRRTALTAVGLATLGALAGGFLGSFLLEKWRIAPSTLMLAGGIIFFLVGLVGIMQQYEAPQPPAAGAPQVNVFRFVFPNVIPPYGIAAVIVLLSASADPARMGSVVALFAVVMVLNYLAMIFARPIVARGLIVLGLLGAVLGVLQVALAAQIVLAALRAMGVVGPSAASMPGFG